MKIFVNGKEETHYRVDVNVITFGDGVALYANRPGFMAFLCRQLGRLLRNKEIENLGLDCHLDIFYEYESET